MVRLAVLLVGSVELAEEVVQDAFAVVDQRWDQLERPGGYLRATVVNGCRALLRRRRLEERHGRDEQVRTERVGEPLQDGLARMAELRDALDRLDERQRVVVVLRYFVDLPDSEIATIVGCRPSTVRSTVRRALTVLRHELSVEERT